MKQEKKKMEVPRSEKKGAFRKYPDRGRCATCDSRRSYTNPLARCWECKRKFCYDHIWGLQVNGTMSQNEEVRNICDDCKKLKGYRNL